jgi:hypothetical protein
MIRIDQIFVSPGHNFFGRDGERPGGYPAIFELQGVRFFGVEECSPCHWMNYAFRDERAETWLRGRGGLRARILTDGILRREPAVL